MVGILWLSLGLFACARRPVMTIGIGVPGQVFTAIERGHLRATGLVEASGLAASRRQPGLVWAINDSGNEPILFAFAADGTDLGQVTLAGVKNVDWEDLAAFTWNEDPWLLVTDTGDNPGRRSNVVLHALPEPKADAQGSFAGTARPAWSLPFTYPDGPRDCEAVAVDEAAGQILLLSKRSEPPVLYSLPLGPPVDERPQVATVIGPMATIPPPTATDLLLPYGRYRSQPTAMDLSADGRELLILTYRNAYLFRRAPGQNWANAIAESPQIIELPDLFTLAQREAACFSADRQSLFVTGEGAGAALLRLERQ
jgi:hypothetical protein